MVTVIYSHHPEFIKRANHPAIEVVMMPTQIKIKEKYITYDGRWRVWQMAPERIPMPRGRFQTINAAICAAKR